MLKHLLFVLVQVKSFVAEKTEQILKLGQEIVEDLAGILLVQGKTG